MNSKIGISVAIIVLMFANFACGDDLKRDIPHAAWQPIFFRSIDNLTSKIGWKPLREERLPPHSLELRIWIGFGLKPLEGFRLRRDGDQWFAEHVVDAAVASKPAEVYVVTPKSGWQRMWSSLSELEVLTLPDESVLPPPDDISVDGESYVVEISRDNAYRTYEYGNPQNRDLPEAKKMVKIVRTLRDEFGSR